MGVWRGDHTVHDHLHSKHETICGVRVVRNGNGWKREYFSYQFNPQQRPDMRHGGRRPPNGAEPDANVLDQIYSEKLAWRFPKVVEERRRRVLKRVPVNRKTAPCKTRAFDVARCVL